MRAAAAFWTLALSACVAACTPAPVSVRPLYTDAELAQPHLEPRIEGEWISPDDDAGTGGGVLSWKIGAAGPGGRYMVEVREEKPDSDAGDRCQSYEVRLVAIGDRLFFDAQPSLSSKEREQLPFGLLPMHELGRLDVEQDFLRVTLVEGDWADHTLPESLRTPKGDDPAVITASTAELRALFGREADNPKAFAFAWYLCRPGTDCAGRAIDDMLARAPDDLETLEAAAKFFFRRGNYGRAVTGRRRLAELEPEKALRRADLGDALLFNKEFEAARREFGAVVELPGDARARAQEGIVWSYFLEGRFADASNASDSYRSIAANGSANVILLGHLSRLRIGDRAAADAWLKREAASFTGSPDDQILLLSLEKRLNGPPGYHAPTDVERAESLHSAVTIIVGGDWKWASRVLEQALYQAPNDSLIALAAKIELEALRSGIKR